tara:strand:- start:9147 stop:10841 length:1695 start_codon:yes stop_codon:yes gene_type:complete
VIAPRDIEENLRFRSEVVRFGYQFPDNAAALRKMCIDDPQFFFDAFVWTYDPRRKPSRQPFILYDYQREALSTIDSAIGTNDLKILKSRDMGASWLLLTTFLWRWLFAPLAESYLLVSRNESYVDGGSKSLFWKLDYVLDALPGWLTPEYQRNKLRMTNLETGSAIDGESTTGQVARGDRRTAILLDEFAAFDLQDGFSVLSSTRDATMCRVFMSTPNGTGNAFHAVAENKEIQGLKMHWSQHPIKAEGLYELDGKTRSPWYDREVKRCVSSVEVAQELDIDFSASQALFFEPQKISELSHKHVRSPYRVGRMDEQNGEYVYVDDPDGPLHLWIHPDGAGDLPRDREYAIGVDIATGTGASNSAIAIGDRKTGEKVGELAAPNLRPDELARYAVAIARWFRGSNNRGAFMVWEAAGPGRIFGDVVVSDLNYREVFLRKSEGRISKRQSEMLGWYPTRDTKITLFGNYRNSLYSEKFINRSAEAMKEHREIIYTAGGSIEHSGSHGTDPSGARMNHGDRVTADALLNLVLGNQTSSESESPVENGYSIGWRRRRADDQARKASQW